MTDIRVEIGELTVHGVTVVRPERLGTEFEAALTTLLRDGLPTDFRVEPGPITLAIDGPVRSEVLAERLARAVYEGLAE